MQFGFKQSKGAKQQKRELVQLQEERKYLLSEQSDFFIREAFKSLRTNVAFSLAGGEETACKIILVTSSQQGEGKSFTSANLAIAYAEDENRVLLIDCDLRRPKVSRLLELNAPVGLSNLLVNPSLLEKAIIKSKTKGLDVLLAGDIPPNPSELLGSVRMKQLLDGLSKHYDYIILDAPPVNVVTDGLVLAPRSSGVLFVVRSGLAERGAVVHAVRQMNYANVKLLGFVLNAVNMENTGYGGYGKYKYKKYGRYETYETAAKPALNGDSGQ